MEAKRSLQRRKRKTSMTKEELAGAFGFGTSKFQCTADQLTENEVEKRRKVKMKKFSDMIQKSGDQMEPKARESPEKKVKRECSRSQSVMMNRCLLLGGRMFPSDQMEN